MTEQMITGGGSVELTPKQRDSLVEIVQGAYPNEGIALLLKSGRLIGVDNIHEQPLENFRIRDKDYIKYDPVAVIHSHPVTNENRPANGILKDGREPSLADLKFRQSVDIPCGIVSVLPWMDVSDVLWYPASLEDRILGRNFIFNYHDCYHLIRSYHWQVFGLYLNDYPTEELWWDKQKDYYTENFEKEGFHPIDLKDIKVGDSLLGKVKSPVVNHAAIYLGDDKILHHLFGRTARVDRFSTWQNMLSGVVRCDRVEDQEAKAMEWNKKFSI
jgi:hypothetical protein